MYENTNKKTIVSILSAFLIVVALLLLLMSFTIVGAAEQAVVTRLGQINGTFGPGIHFVIPVADRVNKYSSRIQKIDVVASAASKDLQDVSTELAVNYVINSETVVELYVATKYAHETNVLQPVIQESIKAATAKYTAEELVTKRATVKEDILQLIQAGTNSRFNGLPLIRITDVAITNFNFSQTFNAAIESKVRAEQEALKAKNDLERVKFEAEQRITQAKAEAEAIRIQAEAITQQGGDNYVQLKAIEKWKGEVPATMVPGASVPFINLSK